MTFKFDIKDAEYTEFNNYVYRKRVMKKNWFYLAVAIFLIAINALKFRNYDASGNTIFILTPFEFLFISALSGVVFLYTLQIIPRKFKVKSDDRESVLGEREMTLNDQQITTKSPDSEAFYRWSSLKKWEQTTHLYLLFVAENMAILVPKRIFENAEQQAEFEQLLKKIFPDLTNAKYLDA
jgi:hypothetical protein